MKLGKVVAPYTGLNSGIYLLFVARVINCIGNFVFPFLTLFLTSSLNMSEDKAGFFVMLSSLAGVPGTLLGGSLADKLGRKTVLSLSLMLSALCMFPCAFLGKSMLIPWMIILSALFSAMAHPASGAMIADLAPQSKRASAYALLYLGINIGTAIGPLIAGFLFNHYLMLLFIGDGATTFLAALMIHIFVRESIPDSETIERSDNELDPHEKAEKGNTFAILLKRPYLLIFSLLYAVASFVYSQHSFSLPIYTDKLYGSAGSGIFGVLMSVNCIVVVLLTTLTTTLLKRFKPVLNTAIAMLFYMFGFGMIYFSKLVPMLLLSTFVWSVGEIINTTNFQVYIADHSPITHRARFNAVLTFITRSGYTVGPLMMGIFIKHHGIRQVWPVIAALSLFCALGMYMLHFMEDIAGKRSRIAGEV